MHRRQQDVTAEGTAPQTAEPPYGLTDRPQGSNPTAARSRRDGAQRSVGERPAAQSTSRVMPMLCGFDVYVPKGSHRRNSKPCCRGCAGANVHRPGSAVRGGLRHHQLARIIECNDDARVRFDRVGEGRSLSTWTSRCKLCGDRQHTSANTFGASSMMSWPVLRRWMAHQSAAALSAIGSKAALAGTRRRRQRRIGAGSQRDASVGPAVAM